MTCEFDHRGLGRKCLWQTRRLFWLILVLGISSCSHGINGTPTPPPIAITSSSAAVETRILATTTPASTVTAPTSESTAATAPNNNEQTSLELAMDMTFTDINDGAWSPDGKTFVVAEASFVSEDRFRLLLLDAKNGSSFWARDDFAVQGVTFDSSGSTVLALGPGSGELTSLSATDGSRMGGVDGVGAGCGQGYELVGPDARGNLYSAQPGNTSTVSSSKVVKWHMAGGMSCSGPIIEHQGFLAEIAVSDNGDVLMTGFRKLTGEHERKTYLWDLSTQDVICDIPGDFPAMDDSGQIVTVSAMNEIQIWDVGECTHRMSVETYGTAKAIDGSGMIMAVYTGTGIEIWNLNSHSLIGVASWGSFPEARLMFSNDGKQLLALSGGTSTVNAHATVWTLPR